MRREGKRKGRGGKERKEREKREGKRKKTKDFRFFVSHYCQGENAIFIGSLVCSMAVIFMFPHLNFPKYSVINCIRRATFVFRCSAHSVALITLFGGLSKITFSALFGIKL